jgi:hypothetical protein
MVPEPDSRPISRKLKGIDESKETKPPGMSSRKWDKKRYKQQENAAQLPHFRAQRAKEQRETAIAAGLDPDIVEKIEVQVISADRRADVREEMRGEDLFT